MSEHEHQWVDVTTNGMPERTKHFVCGSCAAQKTEHTSETPREVFEALLDSYSCQHTFDDYPIAEQGWWPDKRAEWLTRFDAAEKAQALDVFRDLLATMLTRWIVEEAKASRLGT